MLLKITSKGNSASNLGFLLHKHPDRYQIEQLPYGAVHMLYPEVSEEHCSFAMHIEINSVHLARTTKENYNASFKLGHYVNDRSYVASSFLTTAISKFLGSALNGKCNKRPELVDEKLSLEIEVAAVKSRKGKSQIIDFFEPLGYTIDVEEEQLDASNPGWGSSPYFNVKLQHNEIILKGALTHLYVLLPVLDNNKHYYVSEDEVQKLLDKGGEWLKDHPAKELITKKYLKFKKSYTRLALDQLIGETDEIIPIETEEKISLHQIRLETVAEELKKLDIKTVVDLGCGEGKLLKLLLKEKQFEKVLGMDISYRSLEIAKKRLYWDRMSEYQKNKIDLIHGSLNYKDDRIAGFEGASLVEVIEHLDEPRLQALEKVVFKYAKPKNVIITTPNKEYNVLFEGMSVGQMRHSDHRFEWTRKEFETWGDRIAETFDYEVSYKPLGEVDKKYGGASQMAIFKTKKNE
ncbi:3' terminal RNA ribose 2'-O-methyltransferase Hen1 [Aquimarina sp. MAR_2010_214]|uniref:3' terminal RNA ribose 2'-O-methyltransferase Hen1 n=1 Tax=Aquimarina sp. MAR_2010_214 TaxID=1250026 RepID=UPI000C6FF395|nr:3' terminal RNA ribose 2'-O-methyltransferase Hen1 [Aquimarina sp. MAR_2010_214]PKV48088.1 3' terminal RNA ribose 2'-O-methyltransferase Hen1 [Aquimarina sp. MAR_2010_214]